MSEHEDAKDYWSKNHIQSTKLAELDGNQKYRVLLAEKLLALKPESIFEFGCNVGRNLLLFREMGYTGELLGYEQSERAAELANKKLPQLNIKRGDEKSLKQIEDNRFDIVFTLSVLDHNWEWKDIYNDLKRITKKHLFLVEPQLITEYGVFEGSLVGHSDAVPFTYSWDYQLHDPALTREPFDAIRNNVFPHFSTLYKLFHLEK